MAQLLDAGGELFNVEATLLGLFVIIILVGLVARYFRLPYTTVLVIVGFLIALSGVFPKIVLTPDLVLLLFLPPLAFEAAFHLDFARLRSDLTPVAVFALVGVILTMLVAGAVMALALGIDWGVALLFGALIAATDPVSVVAVFRELGVAKRLVTLMEAESLFNDGTGIVLFRLVLAVVLTGVFHPGEGVLDFIRLLIGGIALGAVLGFVASRVLSHINDYLIEISVTVVLAWGSYLLGESIGVSGVITVVVAGLVLGTYGERLAFTPTTKIMLEHILEFIAFVANSFIFLLIGLQVEWIALRDNFVPVLWAIVAALVARAVVVYGLSGVMNRFITPIPLKWQHLLFWGGMRGGVTLALALSLPLEVPLRNELLVAAFAVVLFTLVVQGLTIRPLVQRLGLAEQRDEHRAHDEARGRLMALYAGERRLDELRAEHLIADSVYEPLKAEYTTKANALSTTLEQLHMENAELTQTESHAAEREALSAQRSELFQLQRRGLISDEVYDTLAAELDAELERITE